MLKFEFNHEIKDAILALGAESAGNFSVYQNGQIYFSDDFGNLLEEKNFETYKKQLQVFLKKNNVKPSIILSDLHPLFLTTDLAKKLAKKYAAKHFHVQHHLAHIFSAIGDKIIHNPKKQRSCNLKSCLGIACDGTGYGFDEKIWGGEVFKMQHSKVKTQYNRIAHLENQLLLGGELAIKEPARVLIAVLSNFLAKEETYKNIKKHYRRNEFELLWNQLKQNFHCLETSSTARILDAVSVLLGFSGNESLLKHGPVASLEKNSTIAYSLKPIIEFDEIEKNWILKTTPLFEYLIENINMDKKCLAATAQKYIADGLMEIIRKSDEKEIYFAGGMANNKIISESLSSQGIYLNKKIPSSDAGISVGQIFYYILKTP